MLEKEAPGRSISWTALTFSPGFDQSQTMVISLLKEGKHFGIMLMGIDGIRN